MSNSLQDVQDFFTDLNAKYNMLRAACTNDTDRTALESQYGRAQAAYQTSLGQILTSDDPQVATLGTQFTAASAVVKNAVEEMGDMCKVIDGITDAVNIAAKIIGFACPGVII